MQHHPHSYEYIRYSNMIGGTYVGVSMARLLRDARLVPRARHGAGDEDDDLASVCSDTEAEQRRQVALQKAAQQSAEQHGAEDAAHAAREAEIWAWIGQSASQRGYQPASARCDLPSRGMDGKAAMRVTEALHGGSGGFRRTSQRLEQPARFHLTLNTHLPRRDLYSRIENVRLLDPGRLSPRAVTSTNGSPGYSLGTFGSEAHFAAEERLDLVPGRASQVRSKTVAPEARGLDPCRYSPAPTTTTLYRSNPPIAPPTVREHDRFADTTSNPFWCIYSSLHRSVVDAPPPLHQTPSQTTTVERLGQTPSPRSGSGAVSAFVSQASVHTMVHT